MGKIETLALLVAVVGVGMAIYYTKNKTSGGIVQTQYGQAWNDAASSNGGNAIVYL